eukprot:440588-Pelagomonas_calceolata.AAC.1
MRGGTLIAACTCGGHGRCRAALQAIEGQHFICRLHLCGGHGMEAEQCCRLLRGSTVIAACTCGGHGRSRAPCSL